MQQSTFKLATFNKLPTFRLSTNNQQATAKICVLDLYQRPMSIANRLAKFTWDGYVTESGFTRDVFLFT